MALIYKVFFPALSTCDPPRVHDLYGSSTMSHNNVRLSSQAPREYHDPGKSPGQGNRSDRMVGALAHVGHPPTHAHGEDSHADRDATARPR